MAERAGDDVADRNGAQPLVELRGISKAFPGVLANDAVDLVLHPGQVHALLGENGAGKSTLVKILYGLLSPDSGAIYWRGKKTRIANPSTARTLGIAMVFQHFSLFESLTVLENIALGMGVPANARLRQRIIDVAERYGLALDPDRSVYTLSVGARQRIEIVRCLLQEPELLVMDEPTSVLTPQEVEQLFDTLKRLADEGVAILYISHKLEEIRTLCDQATVLREGRKVAEADPREETAASLAALMMGQQAVAQPAPHQANNPADDRGARRVRLQLANLSAPAQDLTSIALANVSLSLHEGEILGIAGVAGNGQDELLSMLAGERLADAAGAIELDGQAIGQLGASERRRRGLCCVPEERLGHAAVPDMSLADNAYLTARDRRRLNVAGMRVPGRAEAFARDIIEQFNVSCNGPGAVAASLSGGNLQKFVVGREILQQPDVLVVSQPTWGVDAGAAAAIHGALSELASRGAAVLVISQDLDELFLVCDRIGALCAGKLSRFHASDTLDHNKVGLLMGGIDIEVGEGAAA